MVQQNTKIIAQQTCSDIKEPIGDPPSYRQPQKPTISQQTPPHVPVPVEPIGSLTHVIHEAKQRQTEYISECERKKTEELERRKRQFYINQANIEKNVQQIISSMMPSIKKGMMESANEGLDRAILHNSKIQRMLNNSEFCEKYTNDNQLHYSQIIARELNVDYHCIEYDVGTENFENMKRLNTQAICKFVKMLVASSNGQLKDIIFFKKLEYRNEKYRYMVERKSLTSGVIFYDLYYRYFTDTIEFDW